MPVQSTFVTKLLRLYHRNQPSGSGLIGLPTMNQAEYLCQAGLGPIAFRIYGDALRQSDPAIFSLFRSADLTTKVIYSQMEEAAVELAQDLNRKDIVPTFLKGISTSDEFYAPPYLRVMGDIDVLVKPSEVDLVMTKISELGYIITDEQWRNYRKHGSHHLPEARHPLTGISIEVHTGLFGVAEFYSQESAFQPESIEEQTIEFNYRGTRAARFTPELQLIYTVSKWSVDSSWSVNLTNINDTIHILKKYESVLHWPRLSDWFAVSPHLFPTTVALLTYLEQADIVSVSPNLREALAGADRELAPRTLKLLTWLLHTYTFNARNSVHSGFSRWCTHSLWLLLTNPNRRALGIPGAILYQFCMSALYGDNYSIRRLLFEIKALFLRLRNSNFRN
jgi:hypothetical protein